MKCVWENVELFEDLLAEFAGSNYAVAVDSCTNALFLSMMWCREAHYISPGDEVNVPAKTYISVPMQAIHAGYKVKFHHDYWSGTYQLNPLPVIDSAQRFTEGMYNGHEGSLYCLSFHSKKILSIGRGGMILTNNKNCRDWLRSARHDGRSSIYYNDLTNNGPDQLGWHMYMTPEQAVRGIDQFYGLPEVNEDSGCASDYQVDLSTLSCFDKYLI